MSAEVRGSWHGNWDISSFGDPGISQQPYLVGGLEHFLFFHILGIIILTDSYFSEGFKPPTRY